MTNFFVFRGVTVFFDRLGPVIGILRGGVIFPIFYFPLIAEFVSILIFYFVVIPYYFAEDEYQLQFDDPLNIGGLEPVERLLKNQSTFIVLDFYLFLCGSMAHLYFQYFRMIILHLDGRLPHNLSLLGQAESSCACLAHLDCISICKMKRKIKLRR